MFEKKVITDLFFDLDHTIYDFDKNSALTFHSIFDAMDLRNVSDFMTHFKPINDFYWAQFANDEISHDFLRYGRLRDTFEAINVQVSDEEIYYIADTFIANLTNYNHVFEGALEVLSHLEKKYKLHIITNGPSLVQEKKLKNAHLDVYFKTVTNSEKAGVKKPNPKIFQYALEEASARPENSIMIGDNLQADVEGALNVGMHAIWFNEFGLENKSIVTEIKELKQLIKIL